MISFIKIANVASYNGNGCSISELKKINFFYGANGCGKTTISNFLANPNDDRFTSCSMNWHASRELKTLVYNKQFREDNFGTGTIAGIFTLGQATREEIEFIETQKTLLAALHEEQANQKSTILTQETRLKDINQSFTDDCWVIYKKYEKPFKDALYGHISSKSIFRDKILSVHSSNQSILLSLEELQKKAATLLGKQPNRIEPLPTLSSYNSVENIEINSIWQKVIVGKTDVDIAGLISKLGNSDWVNLGRNYIVDETCPFCQQATLSEAFKQEIEEYFDQSFKDDQDLLLRNQQLYNTLTAPIISKLSEIEDSEKSNNHSKLDVEKFSAHLRALSSQIAENQLLIREKVEKTSHQISLVNTKREFQSLDELITSTNEIIAGHNQLVLNYDQQLSMLKNEIWRFLVEELKDKILDYQRSKSGLERGIENISNQIDDRKNRIQSLEREIVELSKNVTSVQPAVDEINRLLSAYGFTNFKIVPSVELENYYAISRENGDLAHDTLSEGEVTFITFLYFVQLAKGALNENSVTEDRVLVIDDPISSLDSNILYVVSTIVKELIKKTKDGGSNIKQLLLLTHNVYFHKEASFINSRSNSDSDTNFSIIRKNQNVTTIQSYGQNNPIESSYELLWREIKDWQNNSGITLQNTMRRIIESYFKILGKFTDDDLVSSFETLEEKQICRSLISWVNDGSHTIPDDLYVQTPDDSAENYLDVFKKIFERTNNKGHYEMMMGVE